MTRLTAAREINLDRPVTFTFDGKTYQGYEGDTLASALVANGVDVLSRSFKRHRPRGLFSLGIDDTGAIVQAGTGATAEPNARATATPALDGVVTNSQNSWPSLQFDVLRTLDVVSDLFPAGFYNKTFMWPNWHWYEWAVRHVAGFGKAPKLPDPDGYAHQHLNVDVLVCGGGPAGLASALAEANSGKSVLLVEQEPTLGGSLKSDPMQIDSESSDTWLSEQVDLINSNSSIDLRTRTTTIGLYDHNYALLLANTSSNARQELLRVRAKKIIIATGAIEQPLVFENNDRPGIMLLTAVQGLARRFGVVAGKKIVVAGNHDRIYAAAAELSRAGLNITAVVDARTSVEAEVREPAENAGIKVLTGHMPFNSSGGKRLKNITLNAVESDATMQINCDTLAISGGYAPAVHLACHAKLPLRYEDDLAAFVPGTRDDSTPIGAAAGDFDLTHTLNQIAQPSRNGNDVISFSSSLGPRINPLGDKRNQWVDWVHDVTLSDLELAVRENLTSVEHLKRYTTNGMAIDQGKTSNLNALTHLAAITSREVAEVGTTTYRPPYTPVTMGALVGGRSGQFFMPVQRLPMHAQHASLDAVFEDYGSWKRPAYYRNGTEEQSINDEVRAVRNGVGLFDQSPLGKLDVRGPDAAEFLHRIYLNNVLNLKPGAGRYGLMLNENGIIIDDGIFARISETHFVVSTTSGGASRIYNMMEEWLQCEWVDLNVTVTNSTTAWANVTIAGPKARDLVSKFDTDIDLSREAFPHQSIRTGSLEGIPVRILRASFSGELCYEVNVPTGYGAALWDAAMNHGDAFGVKPYGVESVMTMRVEKGFMHIGSDTDGTTVPGDVGWGHIAERKAAQFIGKRSLFRPHSRADDRHQFIGLEPVDGDTPLHAGGHLTSRNGKASEGYLTSAAYSPSLDRYIALGLLRRGRDRMDEIIDIYDQGARRAARVVDPVHYDKEGVQLNV